MADESYSFVVVSNRLPVDRVVDEAGNASWKQSPGGLVTALEPVMRAADGAWVGWAGQADIELEPFDEGGIRIVPVPLSESDLELYYEGFSNDTLWPLYHDVIAQPSCNWCRRCCASGGPTSSSGSSTTSRSRRTASSRSCRGAGRSSTACSARTWSGSSGWRMPATSRAPCG